MPNGTNAVANLTNDISGDQLITLDAARPLGSLRIGDASGTNTFTLSTLIGSRNRAPVIGLADEPCEPLLANRPVPRIVYGRLLPSRR